MASRAELSRRFDPYYRLMKPHNSQNKGTNDALPETKSLKNEDFSSSEDNLIPCFQAQQSFRLGGKNSSEDILLEKSAHHNDSLQTKMMDTKSVPENTTRNIENIQLLTNDDSKENINNNCGSIDDVIMEPQIIDESDENLSKSTIADMHNLFNETFLEKPHIKSNFNQTKDEAFNNSTRMNTTQEYKTSQYKREILGILDNWEMTLCNQNNHSILVSKQGTKNVEDVISPNMEVCSNSFYDLPIITKSLILQYKGIEKMYEWQHECLTLPAVKNRQNLIYALPTSGGKTLVAEILMLKEVICRKKNVLFILPFVSIVQEKVWGLSPFAVALDFLVEEYAGGKGSFPPRKRRKKKSIYIATMEKGLGLVRSLTEEKRLSEIGLIVVDELHLLGESNRGSTLEMLLTNVMHSGESIQIIGMSATIGNIEELAKFLHAQVFTKDFRPVELKEYVKYGKNILSIDWNSSDVDDKIKHFRNVDFCYSPQVEKLDPDHIGGLVMEVIPDGSCLVFCPTKKNCENVAVLLCKVISKKLLEYRKQEKSDLEAALRSESGGDDLLLSLVPWGIAYHHSGLAFDERRLIEDAFRSGVLNVICCTSTLAAGVNLPAQRVILRAPMVGRSFINLSTYKQMVGRAGRAGFGGHGDSILICPSHQTDKVRSLIGSPMDNVNSSLHENNGTFMKSFLLGAIASETATNRKSLRLLISNTLLSVQAERLNIDLKKKVDETIVDLIKMAAIQVHNCTPKICEPINVSVSFNQTMNASSVNEVTPKLSESKGRIKITNHSELTVTKFGKAAVKGCIDMKRAHLLYSDLNDARRGLVVIGVLHLLYLITPYDVAETIKPNLSVYYSLFSDLQEELLHMAKKLGFTESIIVKMAIGKVPQNIPVRVFNRFYVTLILFDLWNQEPLQKVSEKFQVNRGLVQTLMEQAASFASSVLRFCEELDEFWAFKDLLTVFAQRLSHCCMTELIPLMDLPSVKKNRAMQLYKAGYKSIRAIAQANAENLTDSIKHLTFKTANQLIAAAKLILLEKVENLREEAQDVIDDLGKD